MVLKAEHKRMKRLVALKVLSPAVTKSPEALRRFQREVEAAAKLTPAEVDKFPREHPRCGTAFLLTVVVFSILLFALLGPMPLLTRLLTRVLLIPVLASLAYEYLRWSAAHFKNPIVRLLVAPNLALQDLTTRQPDKKMLEVGIAAFKEMKRLEDKATI